MSVFHNLKDWVILSVNGGKVGFGMFAVGGVRCAQGWFAAPTFSLRCSCGRRSSLRSHKKFDELMLGERDYLR